MMEHAQELMLWGKYQDARDVFLAMLAEDRSNPDLVYHLGLCALGDEDYAEALRHFELCLNLEPGHVDAALDAGEALLALDRIDEAATRFSAVLARHPENHRAVVSMARYYDYLEDYPKAVEYFEQALRLGDGWDSPRFELALAYIKVERFLEADLALEAIIAENLRRGTQAFMGEWAPGSREDLARSINEMREEREEIARLFAERHGFSLGLTRLMYKAVAQLATMDVAAMAEVYRELKALQMFGIKLDEGESVFRIHSLGGTYAGSYLVCLLFALQQELKFDGMVPEVHLQAWSLARALF